MPTTFATSSSRALVALVPESHAPESNQTRDFHRVERVATFLTQMIATARQLPQARARRRADAADVIAAYRSTVERIQKLNEKSA